MSQYVFLGRGGAGNAYRTNDKEKNSPKLVPEGSQTPNLLQPIFSTGRGGAGNMRRNVDPKLTRIAQDVGDDKVLWASDEDDDLISSDEDRIDRKISSVKSAVSSSNNKLKSSNSRPVMIGRGGAGNLLTPTTSQNMLHLTPSRSLSQTHSHYNKHSKHKHKGTTNDKDHHKHSKHSKKHNKSKNKTKDLERTKSKELETRKSKDLERRQSMDMQWRKSRDKEFELPFIEKSISTSNNKTNSKSPDKHEKKKKGWLSYIFSTS